MSDPPPPTTSHILRPHHVNLLNLFLLTFLEFERTQPDALPPPFFAHIYRVLLRETAEVTEPKGYTALAAEIKKGPLGDLPASKDFNSKFALTPFRLSTTKEFTEMFERLPLLYDEKDEEEGSGKFIRRSLFGYFCRRCFLSFCKLSFTVRNLALPHAKYLVNQNQDYQIHKTSLDKKPLATGEAYAAFEKGLAVGDENIATENLRRFFEQHFHQGSDSLLHRLPPTERGAKPILNDIQPDLHPLEVLFDVQKLVQISNQQPLSASFEKIVQATGLYDHWLDVQRGAFVEAEQWGQHAVQSVVWNMHGSIQLAQVEENIVTAFTEVGGDDNNRLIVNLNRAYHRARQGKYEDAIAILLEPDVWCGLTLTQYHNWANKIWHIFALRASRRGQERQFSDFLKQRRPHGVYRAREYWFWSPTPLGSMVRDPIYEAMQMRHADQAHAWVEPLLKALWHAEFQGRYGLYRTALVILADVGLEFGMTQWCRRIIDEIMPQVISGAELEQRALACFTLARCIIASGDSSPEALRECLPYLSMAEADYATLEILRSLQDVQYLLSVVYHNLGMTAERDEAAVRHLRTEEERKKAATTILEPWVLEVWELVGDVGAALAAR
ncbi:hypothetical protein POSPLADRAFT_1044618 [Postia placenta MAD-698-R-SB12]|uniref:Anaphase-promoting complex subunit 5 n=1 Tax=Postia placenta MAD-698-R-SB12 TaxID=670580 RepID=A0A1X6NA27_9APHY|nr:hypothetical protein POSPLADRAFT_1044618 [Postia placenta MAD-698-R-SB12]OSX65213.1 hypothetical protein POSPLADRAFT_1044618 [Postia placenta MAD-698-R-SB12]